MSCSVESSEIDLSEFQEENQSNGDDGDLNNQNESAGQGEQEPSNPASEPAPGNHGESNHIFYIVFVYSLIILSLTLIYSDNTRMQKKTGLPQPNRARNL